jgi:hypothetical protein
MWRLWIVALSLLIAWLGWHEGVRWRDDYISYSGTVVAKGEDYSLIDIFLSDHSGPDLYIILQDERGNRSKRYVGSGDSSINDWSRLETGKFVVKNKGLGEFPREPGKTIRSISPPLPNAELSSRDFLFIGLLVLIGLTVVTLLRRFR